MRYILSSCSCSYSSSFGFSFLSVAHVCQTFNQICVAFNVFLFFAFSLSCSTMFWFDKANRLSAIFFSLWCSNLALPRCFHGNFCIALYNLGLHSITYLCIRHWPIRNKIFCWVYNKGMLHFLLSPIQFPYHLLYCSIGYGNAMKFQKFRTNSISSSNDWVFRSQSHSNTIYDQCISPQTMGILMHRFCLKNIPSGACMLMEWG